MINRELNLAATEAKLARDALATAQSTGAPQAELARLMRSAGDANMRHARLLQSAARRLRLAK